MEKEKKEQAPEKEEVLELDLDDLDKVYGGKGLKNSVSTPTNNISKNTMDKM